MKIDFWKTFDIAALEYSCGEGDIGVDSLFLEGVKVTWSISPEITNLSL